jgi:hypothetical protein
MFDNKVHTNRDGGTLGHFLSCAVMEIHYGVCFLQVDINRKAWIVGFDQSFSKEYFSGSMNIFI